MGTRLCDYGERSRRTIVNFVESLVANVSSMVVFSSVFFWTLLSLQLLVSGDLIVEYEVEDGLIERVARSTDVDDFAGLHSRLYTRINATEEGLTELKKLAESNEDLQKFYLEEDLDHATAHIEEGMARILPLTANSVYSWAIDAGTNLTMLESHDLRVVRAKSLLRDLRSRAQSLDEGILRIGDKQGFCSVKYNGKCFWLEIREGEKIGCDEIADICSEGGGKPASVYSQLHYNELVRFIRSVVVIKPSSPRENYLDSWIVSSYHPQTNHVVLPDGGRARYVKWMSGHPRHSACCCMAVKVSSQWDAVYQDMFNPPHGHQAKSVICEK